jgi:hypothetical protein
VGHPPLHLSIPHDRHLLHCPNILAGSCGSAQPGVDIICDLERTDVLAPVLGPAKLQRSESDQELLTLPCQCLEMGALRFFTLNGYGSFIYEFVFESFLFDQNSWCSCMLLTCNKIGLISSSEEADAGTIIHYLKTRRRRSRAQSRCGVIHGRGVVDYGSARR